MVLNDTLDKMDLIDSYRTYHPKGEVYTFFSRAHGSFSKIDHRSSLSKFKRIEIISSISLDHNDMKLEINLNKKESKTFRCLRAK